MNSAFSGSYVPGDSPLHRMNAFAKLLEFFILIAAVVLTDSLWGYALLAIFSLAVIRLSGVNLNALLRPIARLWLFFLVIFIMNTLFFEGAHVIFSRWIFHVSTEGMMQGANIVLRVIFLMALSNVFTATTAPIEIMGALETMLLPLRLFRIPTGDIAMILSVAMQFIPALAREADMIKKAQIARGAKFESTRLRDRAKSITPLVVPVFLAAFRRADELSLAMEARGYRGAKKRTKRLKAPFRPADLAAFAASLLLFAAQYQF